MVQSFSEMGGSVGGELWVLSIHREPPRRVVTTALHVLGEDGGHGPGGTTVTRELCPHTGIRVVKIQGRGEGVCFPSNKQTNQPDQLVTMFQLLQAATEELVCLHTQRGDKVRKS